MTLATQIDEDGNCPTCKRSMQMTYALNPPSTAGTQPATPAGCVCPSGANLSCGNPFCPRKAPQGVDFGII